MTVQTRCGVQTGRLVQARRTMLPGRVSHRQQSTMCASSVRLMCTPTTSRSLACRSNVTGPGVHKPASQLQAVDPRQQASTQRGAQDTAAGVSANGVGDEPRVREALSPEQLVLQDTMPIRKAVELLLSRNASGAPVVNDEGSLVGVLTEGDLLWKGAGAPEPCYVIPPIYIPLLEQTFSWPDMKTYDAETHKILARTVGEAMTRRPITIAVDAPLSEAAHLMLHHKINQLPVMSADGKCMGAISRHDILTTLIARHSPFFA